MIHLFGHKARLLLEDEDGKTFEVETFLEPGDPRKLNVSAISDAIIRNYESKPKCCSCDCKSMEAAGYRKA